MTLHIISGPLQPVQHDGSSVSAVYGVDAAGLYLGVVPAASAAVAATGPPPRLGRWRWSAGAWVPHLSAQEQAQKIEAQRDALIDSGVAWNGKTWYADNVFQQQIAAYLQAFSLGILPAGATVGIRAQDKTITQLGAADLATLAGVVMQFVQQAYTDSWTAKAAIGA